MRRSAAAVVLFALAGFAVAAPVVERGVTIPLPAGGQLLADVVRPAGPGRFPTIYFHTCYGRRHVTPTADAPFHAELTAHDRYVYVATDWRGYPPPVGKPLDLRIDHGKDGAAAVEWIARQPWSDGKVGVWGHSAVAGMAFKIMRERPPHLVCAVPASGIDGMRYGQFFVGGVLEKQHWDIGTRVGHHVLRPLLKRNVHDRLWRRIEGARKPMPSRIPVLLISGWFDTNPGLKLDVRDELTSVYGDAADRVKMLVGPWHHTAFGVRQQGALELPEAEGETGRETLRFFDRHLRGVKTDDEPPAVRYFVMGRNEWREAGSWPPSTRPMTLHLEASGGLAARVPDAGASRNWTHDPADPVPTSGGASILEFPGSKTKAGPADLRPILGRADVLRFTSPILETERVVAGSARVVLHVASDREDTDVAVWLADVHPDGRAILVADGILRLSFRDSLGRPRPLTPDEATEVTIELTPTATAFRPGHRILLAVASSNYPRFDRHPEKARNQLTVGPSARSRLVLPVVESLSAVAMKPGLHEFRVRSGDLERSYLVQVPPADAEKTPRAVVLVFHGGGGTARGVMAETGWAKKAGAEGFLAVFPQGTRADPSHPARFVGNPQTWNDGSRRGGVGAVARDVDDVAFVRRMLDDLEARFSVDRGRVYATGFSNGASMAFRIGRELAPRVAAIAPVAGSDWTRSVPKMPPSVLHVTGTVDPLNPIGGGEIRIGRKSYGVKPPTVDMIRRWAKLVGAPGTGRVVSDEGGVKRVVHGPGRDGAVVVLVTVEGLGHHWPGGKSVLPTSLAGPRSDVLDATDAIWRFFAAHPRTR